MEILAYNKQRNTYGKKAENRKNFSVQFKLFQIFLFFKLDVLGLNKFKFQTSTTLRNNQSFMEGSQTASSILINTGV